MKSAVVGINMRGWEKWKMGSTRLSTVGQLRKNLAKFAGPLKDSEPCMWEFTLRFPPRKKK